jgi:hypothetical protein
MFSTNTGVKTNGMHGTGSGRLALHKGEGRVRVRFPGRRLEHFEWYSSARIPLTLVLSPSARGEATKRTHVGICGARFHEK